MQAISYLLGFLNRYQEGVISLAHGQDKFIEVKTRFTPTEVWISPSADGIPVCHGNTNCYNVEPTEDGFILQYTVESDTATIKWMAFDNA